VNINSTDKVVKKKVSHNPGVAEAGIILEFIEGSLFLINKKKRFDIYPPSPAWLKRSHNLAKRIEEFSKFSESIPAERFEGPWIKHVGGMSAAHHNSNGDIHLYQIDDGLLSKSLPPVGTDENQLTYKDRSRFFCNRVFGLDIRGQRLKSRIHFHAFSLEDVITESLKVEGQSVMLAIRNLIAADHGPDGNYIKRSTLKFFSHRSRCPDGVPMSQHLNLVMNKPSWFQQQVSLWQR
jgi:hypothetical protein